MNLPFKQLYAELILDLKAYITQEHPHTTSLTASPQNFNYFKAQAMQLRASATSAAVAPQPIQKPATALQPPKITPSTPSVQAPIAVLPEAKPMPTPLPAKEPEAQPEKKPVLDRNLKREALVLYSQKTADFAELRKLWQQLYPNIPLADEVPSDEKAKIISQRWKTDPSGPEIIVLYFTDNSAEIEFLSKVTDAISQRLAPAGLLSASKFEAEKSWLQLFNGSRRRLILAQHHCLEALPELMKHYREDPVRGHHTLGKIPLLLLSDISHYLREPKLKASLWNTLCQRLR